MKRILALVLTLALLLSCSSCLPVDSLYRPQDTEPESSTAESPFSPTLSAPPAWSTANDAATAFLQYKGIVDCSKREYSYAEMLTDLRALAEAYPEHFSYESFGQSVAGRELYVAKLGNPNAKQQILVSAGIHGREYLTPLLVMKQMEFYLSYYEAGSCHDHTYRSLLNEFCFYVVPMTNPDGIMLAQAGLSSLSDEELYKGIYATYYKDYQYEYTQQTSVNEYLKIWKANANGVDLNRNFDALWDEYDGIKRPSHKNYKGTAAASEPETRAMVELTERLSNVRAVLCIHSQGEVLYWNCGQPEPLANQTRLFAKMISRENGYRVIPDQNNDASFSDWCALKKGLIAVTVETGTDSCPLPISQFPTIWEQNYDLFMQSAAYFVK